MGRVDRAQFLCVATFWALVVSSHVVAQWAPPPGAAQPDPGQSVPAISREVRASNLWLEVEAELGPEIVAARAEFAAGRSRRAAHAETRLRAFAVASSVTDGLCALLVSAAHNRVGLEVLGLDHPWQGTGQKLTALAARLGVRAGGEAVVSDADGHGSWAGAAEAAAAAAAREDPVGDDDVVLLLDAFDTVLVEGAPEMLRKFAAADVPLMFSGDCQCHPLYLSSNETACSELLAWQRRVHTRAGGALYPFPNTGVVIGYAWAWRAALRLLLLHGRRLWSVHQELATVPVAPFVDVASGDDQGLVLLALRAGLLPVESVRVDARGELSMSFAPAGYPAVSPVSSTAAEVRFAPHTAQQLLARCDPRADVQAMPPPSDEALRDRAPPMLLGSRLSNVRTATQPAVLHFSGNQRCLWREHLHRFAWWRQPAWLRSDRGDAPLSDDELARTEVRSPGAPSTRLGDVCSASPELQASGNDRA